LDMAQPFYSFALYCWNYVRTIKHIHYFFICLGFPFIIYIFWDILFSLLLWLILPTSVTL
jgi:hypothetical protein